VRVRLSGLINGRESAPLLGISSSILFWSESVPNNIKNYIFKTVENVSSGYLFAIIDANILLKLHSSSRPTFFTILERACLIEFFFFKLFLVKGERVGECEEEDRGREEGAPAQHR
jgi:hypothetical protein